MLTCGAVQGSLTPGKPSCLTRHSSAAHKLRELHSAATSKAMCVCNGCNFPSAGLDSVGWLLESELRSDLKVKKIVLFFLTACLEGMQSPACTCMHVLLKAIVILRLRTLILKIFASNDWPFGKSQIILKIKSIYIQANWNFIMLAHV